MNGACDFDSAHKDWKVLYLAAIGEKDESKVKKRILDAEHAIFLREREVFYTGTSLEEKEALEDALYALRALDHAREHAERPSEAPHVSMFAATKRHMRKH